MASSECELLLNLRRCKFSLQICSPKAKLAVAALSFDGKGKRLHKETKSLRSGTVFHIPWCDDSRFITLRFDLYGSYGQEESNSKYSIGTAEIVVKKDWGGTGTSVCSR